MLAKALWRRHESAFHSELCKIIHIWGKFIVLDTRFFVHRTITSTMFIVIIVGLGIWPQTVCWSLIIKRIVKRTLLMETHFLLHIIQCSPIRNHKNTTKKKTNFHQIHFILLTLDIPINSFATAFVQCVHIAMDRWTLCPWTEE